MRELETLIITRAFGRQHVEKVLELHRSQYNLFAYGTFGTKYNTGTARASGSPETAALNSIINAFCAFLAKRKTKVGGAFVQATEAWKQLGLYGGDDGITADLSTPEYIAAAKMCGLKLDVATVRRGELGVTFLSRMYGPEVWFGDPSSTCDLPRQLVKIHTTVRLPESVTPQRKLLEKCRSYVLTDANTPVIGPFAQKVVDLHGTIEQDTRLDIQPMVKWGSDLDLTLQYPNGPKDWMMTYARQALEPFHFDWPKFNAWLSGVRRLDDMLSPPSCAPAVPVTPKIPVVVDGDVHTPPPVDKSTKTKVDRRNTRPAPKPRKTAVARPRKSIPARKGAPQGSVMQTIADTLFQLGFCNPTFNALNAVLAAPFYEEWTKRHYPRMSVIIFALECAAHYVVRGPVCAVIMAAFHSALAMLPYDDAVIIHAAWNFAVDYANIRDLTLSWLGY
jgi:hypothetical protein